MSTVEVSLPDKTTLLAIRVKAKQQYKYRVRLALTVPVDMDLVRLRALLGKKIGEMSLEQFLKTKEVQQQMHGTGRRPVGILRPAGLRPKLKSAVELLRKGDWR